MSPHRPPRPIPERLLRRLWMEQAYPALHLRTADGRSLSIILPGTANRNSGPDFLGARIRIADTLYAGDVELHRGSGDWRDHRHQRDARYNSVILHVVFDRSGLHRPPLTQSGRPLPVLVLGEYLNRRRVRSLMRSAATAGSEALVPLRCRGENSRVGPGVIRSWLISLAEERLDMKIRRFGDRLNELSRQRGLGMPPPQLSYSEQQAGLVAGESPARSDDGEIGGLANVADWEQLLYEGIMEALGYENNKKPFVRLARSCTLRTIARYFTAPASSDPVPLLEAALFKIAGFLGGAEKPAGTETIRDKASRRYVRFLRNLWKLSGDRYSGEFLHPTDWQFFRMRPENFPTLRIAGAARLLPALLRKNFFRHIIRIIGRGVLAPGERYATLEGLFLVPASGYWRAHFRFDERARSRIGALVGRGRAGEIMVNAVIPLALLYARMFGDKGVEEGARAVLMECPCGADNQITGLISSQLIRKKFGLDSATLHQGALQLYYRYCSPGRCGECAVGRIVFPAPRRLQT